MSENEFYIKKLVSSDWQALKSIRLKALKSDPSVFGSHYEREMDFTRDEWQSRVEGDHRATFVLYDNDQPIGLTGIVIDKDDSSDKQAFMWGSWIDPAYRNRGLSSLLYEARIEWAKMHPTCEHIIVGHRESNIASKSANQKHGFVFTHSQSHQWHDGTIEDEYFYKLLLK